MKLLIKSGRVVDPASQTDDQLDLLIDNGKIVDIDKNIKTRAQKIVDATGLIVAPGFIDMHVHLREPGQEQKETILTGAKAAAKGGFTSIACMPNTSPVNDNVGVTDFIVSTARKNAVVNVFPIAAVTKGLKGEDLTDMADLKSAGAIAFSDDGEPVFNSEVMRRALEYSTLTGAPIIDHCEDKDLSSDGVMHEGGYSYLYGLKGIPSSSEEIMVSRNILLSRETDKPVHIAHLSVKEAASLIRNAKKKKIKVTAEVTPHHLLLEDASLKNYDTNLKMKPPLRSRSDVKAMIRAMKDGTIDVITTDHAPHTPDEKAVEFDRAPFGVIGMETAVSLILDRFVRTQTISLSRFVEMISLNPARILGLDNKGRIAKSMDGDLTLLDLNRVTVVDVDTFESKSRNCPFDGWELKGCPVITIVRGNIVYPFDENNS
ncbi:MAG: dihydroorotase [Candidatus Aminicenantes bacterium]